MRISAYHSDTLSAHVVIVKEGKALGRVQWADTKKKTCMIAIDHLDSYEETYDRTIVPDDVRGFTLKELQELEAEGIEILPRAEVELLKQAALE